MDVKQLAEILPKLDSNRTIWVDGEPPKQPYEIVLQGGEDDLATGYYVCFDGLSYTVVVQ